MSGKTPLCPEIEIRADITGLYLGYRNREEKDDRPAEESFARLLMSGIKTGELSSRKCVGMIGAETFFEILKR